MYRFRRCRNRLSFYYRIYFHFWPWFEEIDIVLLDLSFSNILILIQIDILPILCNSKFYSVWIEFRNILVLVAPARPPTEKRWIRVDTKSIWISFRHLIDWKRRIWSFLNHQWHTVRIRSEMEIRILALEFLPKTEFYQKIKKIGVKFRKMRFSKFSSRILDFFKISKTRLFRDFKTQFFENFNILEFLPVEKWRIRHLLWLIWFDLNMELILLVEKWLEVLLLHQLLIRLSVMDMESKMF